jgi:nitrogen fixation NifU-like protein
MNHDYTRDVNDMSFIQEMLSCSGYSNKAIEYYLNRPNMGNLSDADQVSEMTGTCGDTMKVFLKVDNGRIKDAKVQVLGCPGAVASAMVAMELAKGKTIQAALTIKDRDIYRVLEEIPDKKQHCIRLAVKSLQKALDEYRRSNGDNPQGGT